MYSTIQPQALSLQSIELPPEPSVNDTNHQKSRTYGHLNEVIAPAFSSLSICLMTPILSQLTRDQDNRWLTLISTSVISHQSSPDEISHWLKNVDLNINKLLLLTANDSEKTLNLACRALQSGNSHTVVAWINHLY